MVLKIFGGTDEKEKRRGTKVIPNARAALEENCFHNKYLLYCGKSWGHLRPNERRAKAKSTALKLHANNFQSFQITVAGVGLAVRAPDRVAGMVASWVNSAQKTARTRYTISIRPAHDTAYRSGNAKDMNLIHRLSLTSNSIDLEIDAEDTPTISAALGYGLSVALSLNKGLLLHASGVLLDGKAYVFVAPSGGGKSTVIRHCRKGTCLHDDKIAIAWHENEWMTGSTPLLDNRGRVPQPKQAPCGGIFVLLKARKTALDVPPSHTLLDEIASLAYEPTELKWVRKNLLQNILEMIGDVPIGLLRYKKGDDVAGLVKSFG
ncbi:hypothetical protein D6833_07515 [Candidatus Parcubacteria bacterium]|nr:MAG: hypothetical protein D6833_07515 [Candidatus Parcubacteria bacterium]